MNLEDHPTAASYFILMESFHFVALDVTLTTHQGTTSLNKPVVPQPRTHCSELVKISFIVSSGFCAKSWCGQNPSHNRVVTVTDYPAGTKGTFVGFFFFLSVSFILAMHLGAGTGNGTLMCSLRKRKLVQASRRAIWKRHKIHNVCGHLGLFTAQVDKALKFLFFCN